MNDQPIDAGMAATLLHSGETLGTRVQGAIDVRTVALIQAGTAAALFAYILTYVVVFGGEPAPGGNSFSLSIALLLPFLALTSLTLGAHDTLRAAVRNRRASSTLIEVLCLVPFVVALCATLSGTLVSWGVGLGVAICAATPHATRALINGLRARASSVRQRATGPRVQLSAPVSAITLVLALMFGIAIVSATFGWSPFVGLILSAVMLAFVALHSTMWSLAAVGAEWGQAQWLGFALSFLLLMTASIVIARTPLHSPIAGIVAGLVVAGPLAVSAFLGSSIHARAEEFWDAPAPQS